MVVVVVLVVVGVVVVVAVVAVRRARPVTSGGESHSPTRSPTKVFGGWSRDGSTPLADAELLHLGTRCPA